MSETQVVTQHHEQPDRLPYRPRPFIRPMPVAVATIVLIALLVLLWYTVEVLLLLVFAGVLLTVFLRSLSDGLSQYTPHGRGAEPVCRGDHPSSPTCQTRPRPRDLAGPRPHPPLVASWPWSLDAHGGPLRSSGIMAHRCATGPNLRSLGGAADVRPYLGPILSAISSTLLALTQQPQQALYVILLYIGFRVWKVTC
jgi:hypothetical protein